MVARPRSKASKAKPIAQHQLFPAVVALWFSALFGLGSLAIRPSLLEELVIKSRIDLLVPAAAPPLGMTARMLIALILATIGAMIGAWIAYRLAEPKLEVRERKRGNLSTRDEGAKTVAFNKYGNASTRNPDLAGNDAVAPGGAACRRRSLAIEQGEADFVPYEMAPLPGGAPQIFNIAAAGLDDGPAQPDAAAEPGSFAAASQGPAAAPVALDWATAAPRAAAAAPIASAPHALADAQQPQVFAPVETAATDDRQVFGRVPPATPPSDQPRQIFGAPVADEHAPHEFGEAQGFRSSVFAAPEPSPLFAPREVGAAEAAPQPEPAPASSASLGIEDLSARLAESMRRRRAGRSAAAAPAEPAPVAAAGPVEPVAIATQAPSPIPAGLRPLDLSGFEDDDESSPDSLLPPRRIAFAPEAAPAPATPAAGSQPPAAPAGVEADAVEEAAVAEEVYASLLGVTPSPASLRNPFVRVEEPEAEAETIEPVVIFPGQSVPPPQPFAQGAATGSTDPTPFRRFDSPNTAGQGQPSAANEAAHAVPPEEAERALRSALANLQRMSGAA